jgi:peptide methionine sulfoxide reductase msrA/msrB
MKHIKIVFNQILFYFLVVLSACGQNPRNQKTSTVYSDSSMMNQPDEYWKKALTKEEYYVIREKGTEQPFSGKLLMNKDSGVYKCRACGNVLFTSKNKFDSHCGWPSFDEEVADGRIITKVDNSHGMTRTEIMCARCGGHLGHLFDDGPTSTGKRYCVNSVSLEFLDAASAEKESQMDTLTLGGGCFWCIEAVFQQMKGVVSAESGYSGGKVANPSYKDVCTGNTGHAEVVQIIFDKNVTSMEDILKVYFTVHNPTTLNRQGADEGTQYRSIILYRNDQQKKVAQDIIAALTKEKVYDDPIVTRVEPFKVFYKAELSHQDYYENNKNQGYCQMVIQPKLEKFEKVFKDKVKNK